MSTLVYRLATINELGWTLVISPPDSTRKYGCPDGSIEQRSYSYSAKSSQVKPEDPRPWLPQSVGCNLSAHHPVCNVGVVVGIQMRTRQAFLLKDHEGVVEALTPVSPRSGIGMYDRRCSMLNAQWDAARHREERAGTSSRARAGV